MTAALLASSHTVVSVPILAVIAALFLFAVGGTALHTLRLVRRRRGGPRGRGATPTADAAAGPRSAGAPAASPTAPPDPDPSRFDGQPPDHVAATAERALRRGDAPTATAAALWLAEHAPRRALPALLQAVRVTHPDRRGPLVAALRRYGDRALTEHPLLSAALPPDVRRDLETTRAGGAVGDAAD